MWPESGIETNDSTDAAMTASRRKSRGIFSAYSDDVGRAFRLMSATCSDRSRPAVPIDVGRGGGAPGGWL
jgi:hypothetical protein